MKQIAIGQAVGVLLDATVVRALLVPSLMRLLARVNRQMLDGLSDLNQQRLKIKGDPEAMKGWGREYEPGWAPKL